ncbi:restriction endonuclease subunit S [Tateyamaria omphalii]|uniref:restriction endonuclease subunit S n=1 Tax=Tateyamaria omphalii TaxID=299262 RepID=UPI001C991882|nr:restriction endonuclease subunit S [Tateyamaria omphalii]MBY5934089.1 restriction endonuclease subunit S [Tateyamaria omphalii]
MKDTADFGWPTKPLGELVDVLDRLRKPITKKDRTAGPYPYYGATGVLDHVDGYLFDEPLVLIGEDGAKWEAGENSAFAIEGKAWVNNHAHVIRPHRDQVLDDWLIYYLNGTDLMPFVSGMTVPKLNQGRLREIPIPLPLLEVQQRIVAVLDEAFEGLARARAHADANLQNVRDLFTSSLDEVFAQEEWPEFTLQELANEDCSLSYGIVQPGEDVANGLPVVRPVDLGGKIVSPAGLKRVAPERAASYSRTQLNGTELLLCVRGTTGTISLSSHELRGANVTRGIVPIRFNERMNRLFGFYQCQSSFLQKQISEKTYGAALMQINIRDVKTLKLKCPPQTQQTVAVKRMEKISEAHAALLASATDKIANINDLRQSLLQRAFAGELT